VALIQHERIITTLAKAKAVKPFVERLITLARRDDLHARRLVIARLGPCRDTEVKPDGDDADHRTVVQKLFSDIGPRFKDRPGGYTRIIKRHQRRLGDGGLTAYLELLKEGETKVQARQPAPAPRVEEEMAGGEQQPAGQSEEGATGGEEQPAAPPEGGDSAAGEQPPPAAQGEGQPAPEGQPPKG
jgi:large subunit ribosomal protein L17